MEHILLELLFFLLFNAGIKGSSVVTVSPLNVTKPENSTVSIKCQRKGNLMIIWQLPDGTKQTTKDEYLNITAITRYQAGQYRCVATNGTQNWTAVTVITVNFAPEISIQQVLTVVEHSVAEFRCNATGNPSPKIYWESAALNRTWNTSSFNLTNVTRGMSGIFYCIASNGVGKEVKRSMQLNVQYKPEIDINKSTHGVIESWNDQEVVKLYCLAHGNPPPQVSWYKGVKQMTNPTHNSSRLTFNTSSDADFGNYTCNATNSVGDDLLVARVLRREPARIFSISNLTVIEGKAASLKCIASGDPAPLVNWTSPNGTLLQTGKNKSIYHISRANRTQVGLYTCSAYNGFGEMHKQVLFLDVNYKPRILSDGPPVISNIMGANITLECIAEGNPLPNITWTPHTGTVGIKQERSVTSSYIKFTLKRKELFGNYSCNAKNSVGMDVRVITVHLNGTHVPTVNPGKNNFNIYIGAAAGGGGLLLAIVVLVCILMRRQRVTTGKNVANRTCGGFSNGAVNRKSDNYSLTIYPHDDNEAIDAASDLDDIPEDVNYNEFYVNEQAVVNAENTPYEWEYPPERLHIDRVIGKGAFCQVAKAFSDDLGAVAVKMLKANSPESHRRDLLSEVKLMKELEPHPNVVRLLGVITRSEPLMAIVEYIPYGDLLGYLRRSRGMSDNYYKNPDYKPKTSLTPHQLLKFAKQTADGMAFLSKNKIIHRDLAARNVLVGGGLTCKITDFGMARDVQEEDFYQKRARGRLPVKWTAYEALCYGYYTTQSDVWSFGIVLYEIFTIGGCPYPNMDGHKIAYMLQEGYRMEKPAHVDNDLYQMMCECWITEPERRPSFDALSKTLARLQSSHKPFLMMSKYDERIYANVDDLC